MYTGSVRLVATSLALALALLSGCSDPSRDALVVVHIDGNLTGIRQLRLQSTDQGGRLAREVLSPATPLSADLQLPHSLALRTEVGLRGSLDIEVSALDGNGATLESHTASAVAFAPGQTVEVHLCFGTGVGCMVDAGVMDASVRDGAPPTDGGPTPDGTIGPDAAPIVPVTNLQAADLVLGQSDFVSATVNAGSRSGRSLSLPTGVGAAASHVWIADQGNRRVLQWNTLPPATFATADFILGQTSTSTATLLAANYQSIATPGRVSASPSRLAISDTARNRVMLWTNLPAGNNSPASFILGQPDSVTTTAGKAADELDGPEGVWTDGTRVVVADTQNSRVLIWNSWPTQNGAPADLVIGRNAFGIGAGDGILPASATSMNGPIDVWSDGTRLYVCDFTNNRVLVWRSFPTATGQAADFAIGQSSLTASAANAGGGNVSAVGLEGPIAIVGGRNSIFIADLANLRVVVHTPPPSSSGEAADGVLGQAALNTRTITDLSTPMADRIHSPAALALDGNLLWVADPDWNRIERFSLR